MRVLIVQYKYLFAKISKTILPQRFYYFFSLIFLKIQRSFKILVKSNEKIACLTYVRLKL